MRYLIKPLIVLCLLVYGTTIQAQNTIAATGSNATGAGGSVSYTVGQVVYTSNTGTAGSVSQGVQQPYEISVITGLEEAKGISLEIVVYPNPATDFVKLKIKNYEIDNLRFQLFDINGILLQSKKIEENEIAISLGALLPATYFLKLNDNNIEIKTFKIIKK